MDADFDIGSLVKESYGQAEAGGATDAAPDGNGTAVEAPVSNETGPALDAGEVDGASGNPPGSDGAAAEPAARREDGRDDKGRFASKGKETAAPVTPAPQTKAPTAKASGAPSSAGTVPPLTGGD